MYNTLNTFYNYAIASIQDRKYFLQGLVTSDNSRLNEGEVQSPTKELTLAQRIATERLIDEPEGYLVKRIKSDEGVVMIKYGFGVFNWKRMEFTFPLAEESINPFVREQNKL